MEEIIPDLINTKIHKEEFGHFKGSCYLDHTGAAMYAKSQLDAVMRDLSENLYSNPHSNSISSKLCSDTVDQVRYRILHHFNTKSSEYSVIFTSGATHALKMVAESFNFSGKTDELEIETLEYENCYGNCGQFVYLQDNHTSVLGMRNVDNIVKNKVPVKSLKHAQAFEILSSSDEIQNHAENNDQSLHKSNCDNKTVEIPEEMIKDTNCLFVYSAQCNFSGLKYPMSWIKQVQEGALNKLEGKSKRDCAWFCLLDAASYVSTNYLDLSLYKPDFVAVSFYKIFGLPTGLGALIVRNSSASVLHKRYFGGGTVQIALASRNTQVLRPILHERFEDGTISYLSIIALRHGFDWFNRVGLSMQVVSHHCYALAHYTHKHLRRLRHANGCAAVCLYADTDYEDQTVQSGVVNFNMVRDTGDFIGYMEILNLSNLHGIHLRTGCFCNPGTCQRLLGISDEEYYNNFEAGHICGDDHDLIEGRPTGSVRVSFGPYSTQNDVNRLINMLVDCFVTKPAKYEEPENWPKIKEKLGEKFKGVENKTIKTEHNNCGNNGPSNFEESKNTSCNKQFFIPIGSFHYLSIKSHDSLSLSQICLYPVKSCGALSVSRWPLDDRGLLYDRCWMIVNDSGVALTQKQDPRMCLIKPQIDLDKGILTLIFKGEPSCTLPLKMSSSEESEVWMCQSKVCGDNVQALDCGDEAATWLSNVLGKQGVRLIRQSDSVHRQTKKNTDGKYTSLTLSNQAQFLLVNENSVSWLVEKLPQDSGCTKVNMVDRFRSNFVVSGNCTAFEEQKWTMVKIGPTPFKVDGPCGRCQMICIDQSTGVKTKEPLTTLAANSQGRMKFGIYLSQEKSSANTYISVGDIVTAFITNSN